MRPDVFRDLKCGLLGFLLRPRGAGDACDRVDDVRIGETVEEGEVQDLGIFILQFENELLHASRRAF